MPTEDLCHLARQTPEAPNGLIALIEIPMGGRVKYEFDAQTGRLVADRILPDSFPYPANYGTFPCTRAGDGDPLDVLVLTDVPLEPATLILVRPVAVLRMRDHGEADHKIVAVPAQAPGDSVSPELELRITRFFETYKGAGADVAVGPWEDANAAKAIAREAVTNVQQPIPAKRL